MKFVYVCVTCRVNCRHLHLIIASGRWLKAIINMQVSMFFVYCHFACNLKIVVKGIFGDFWAITMINTENDQ